MALQDDINMALATGAGLLQLRPERYEITTALTIPAGSKNLRIVGCGCNATTIAMIAPTKRRILDVDTSSHIGIFGVGFEGYGYPRIDQTYEWTGALLLKGSNHTVKGCSFKNFPGSAIWLISDTARVEGNTFTDIDGSGVIVETGRDVWVMGNSFRGGSRFAAIDVETLSGDSGIKNVFVENNIIDITGAGGISLNNDVDSAFEYIRANNNIIRGTLSAPAIYFRGMGQAIQINHNQIDVDFTRQDNSAIDAYGYLADAEAVTSLTRASVDISHNDIVMRGASLFRAISAEVAVGNRNILTHYTVDLNRAHGAEIVVNVPGATDRLNQVI